MTASPEAHPAEISHSSFYDNSYIWGWLLVSTGKNNIESQPWAAKRWPVDKDNDYILDYKQRNSGALKTARLIQLK